MIDQIVDLRAKGYSFKRIAEHLNTTVGKVQYRYQKYKAQANAENQDLKSTKSFNEQEQYERKSVHHPALRYNVDSVQLLPVDPSRIHCMWDIQESTEKMAEHLFRKEWADFDKSLVVYDVTAIHFDGHNAHQSQCISLPEMTNNWMLTNLKPNRTYIVDIGICNENHQFFSLVRSNPIDTPRYKQGEVGLHQQAVMKWQKGESTEPEWLEHFSTYSYYESLK
ncbi:hypothetical protein AB990_12175 [Alkalihalobacillus pseudalcaliphilus]|nr:hypothetical protein AB990_12175 [Alkalihalobacillus pseudalcaliphilus]